MNRFAIFGKYTESAPLKELAAFLEFLKINFTGFFVWEPFAIELQQKEIVDRHFFSDQTFFTSATELNALNIDFAICLGGDGTFLNSVLLVAPNEIPVLGINMGRLGFLANVTLNEAQEAIMEIQQGHYKIDHRAMLCVESYPIKVFGENNFGLNDLTIHKSNSNEMITIHTYLNGEYINSFWGDGIIISTPTGSTAYSLSCGGPIIVPHTPSFVITPIAPHALTVRPLIFPSDAVLSFEIESRSGQALLAIDARTELIPDKTELALRKWEKNLKMIKIQRNSYFKTLRSRLNWGLDQRN